ncbi:hypothetical protein E4U41_005080, partial [Claviceps citrina]
GSDVTVTLALAWLGVFVGRGLGWAAAALHLDSGLILERTPGTPGDTSVTSHLGHLGHLGWKRLEGEQMPEGKG